MRSGWQSREAERIDRAWLRKNGWWRSWREYFAGGPVHPWSKRKYWWSW